MDEQREVSSGVRELIARLRDDGVKAGREKAGQVLQEAHEEAERIVADAKTRADEILSRAQVQIERDRKACMGSLRTAIRDTELKMETELKADFAAHVRRLVSIEMGDREFIKQCILAVSGMVWWTTSARSSKPGFGLRLLEGNPQFQQLVESLS